MLKLRPYQNELLVKTAQALRRHNRVIMQASTGAGKTVIFSEMVRKHLEKDMFNRVLILTHRTELFGQTLRSIVQTGTTVTTLQAGDSHPGMPRCLIAMVETLKRRDLTKYGDFTLIIVDEAHRADFTPILQFYHDTKTVGATATPISASKKKPLKNIYDTIVCGPKTDELITQGYLAKPIHYKAVFDDSTLRKRGGEYTAETQYSALKVQYTNLVELWRKHASGLKTIVFNVNKQHTLEVNQLFADTGISSVSLLSGDKDREAKLSAFRSGEVTVLNNCEIATTGFDFPGIECVLINRSTASLALWNQMVGRGSRPALGKDSFIVLDFGGNIDRHGMWHTPYDWEKIFHNPAKVGENPAPHKECPECGNLMYASIMVCECGYRFPDPAEAERQKVRAKLEKVGAVDVIGQYVDDLSIHQLYALEKAGRYKPSYIARVARTRGEDTLREYAEMKGYRNGWVHHQNKMAKGYTNYRVKL